MFSKNFKCFLNCNNFFFHTFLLKKSLWISNIIFLLVGILLLLVGAPIIDKLLGLEDGIWVSLNFVYTGVGVLVLNSILTSILLSLYIFKDNYSNGIELLLNSKPINRHIIIISKISFVISIYLIHSIMQMIICTIAYGVNHSCVSANFLIAISFATFILSSLFFGFLTSFIALWSSAKGTRAFIFILMPFILLLGFIIPLVASFTSLNPIANVFNQTCKKTSDELKKDASFMQTFKELSFGNTFNGLSISPSGFNTYQKDDILWISIDKSNLVFNTKPSYYSYDNTINDMITNLLFSNLKKDMARTIHASGLTAINYLLTPFLLKSDWNTNNTLEDINIFSKIKYTNTYKYTGLNYSNDSSIIVAFKAYDEAPNYALALVTLFYVIAFSGLNYLFYLRKDIY